MQTVTIIGAGLAGAEAAWQVSRRGVPVRLFEMRPKKMSPAHRTAGFAELVCSNSLGAASLENARGLLKEEMRRLASLIMSCADSSSIPAGGALAVDRDVFSDRVTAGIADQGLVEVIRDEIEAVPEEGLVIVATGPLTSEAMGQSVSGLIGADQLYFYDAVAPIVSLDSIDMSKVFFSSRYGKGEAAYINCPMTRDEYLEFRLALAGAERVPLKEFERNFEGCMPVEVLAAREEDTMRFGPLKPVGLTDPATGRRPYAVVQLRQDNAAGTLYNIVGFQTNLKRPEQDRVLRMIPGLENAFFVRYGMMHRNTYINSAVLLDPTYESRIRPGLFFAGQITGVEGYVESASSGLMAGINAALQALGRKPVVFPAQTAHGSLARYITEADPGNFQPMNINFGLLPPIDERIKDKRRRNSLLSARALHVLDSFMNEAQLYA